MIYLTPNYETLKSNKNFISYMKIKNYSSDTILAFRSITGERGSKEGLPSPVRTLIICDQSTANNLGAPYCAYSQIFVCTAKILIIVFLGFNDY